MTRFNWNPDKAVFVDLETQSVANLKDGVKAYLAHPSTRLMSAVFALEGVVEIWVPEGRAPRGVRGSELWPDGFDKRACMYLEGPLPAAVVKAIQYGYTFVAHNAAGFDALAWEKFFPGEQPAWFDTIPCARAAGLPAGLDALGKVLLGRGKDEGKEALKLLYTVKERGGEFIYPIGTAALWESVLRYNVADVLLLEKIYDQVQDYGEADVLEADAAINERGIAFDSRLLLQLKELWQQSGNAAAKKLETITGGELNESNIRSGPQVKKWLQKQGLSLESLNRTQLEHFYIDPEAYLGEAREDESPSTNWVITEVLKLGGIDPASASFGHGWDIPYLKECGLRRVFRKSGRIIEEVAEELDREQLVTWDKEAENAGDFLQRILLDPPSCTDPRAEEASYYRQLQTTAERAELCIEVLKLRQAATRISKGKIDRIIGMADGDSRVRHLLVYHGAHTGRWTGRGFQPHNLARGVNGLEVEDVISYAENGELTMPVIETAAELAGASVDDCLNTLLRPVFVGVGGPLLIVDYGAIEARGVAWCAGDESLLAAFSDPGADLYCEMASSIYGRIITKADKVERQIGKVTVLGAGYSMGAPKFALYCKNSRIDLAAAGTSAEACIEAYRDKYPAIAGRKVGKYRRGGLWKDVQAAAFGAVQNPAAYPQKAGNCGFSHLSGNLCITLPSGRVMTYRGARVVDRVPPYCKLLGLPEIAKPTLIYSNPRGYEGTLYGGLITENIVQAICRDLLATALVRLEREGFKTVLHIHDEIICEGGDLEAMAQIMSEAPSWAPGFPVLVEGFTCPRYSKTPFKDSTHIKALNGKVL